MKRTVTDKIPFPIPREIEKFLSGARLYDSSSSPEAKVYFIDKDTGYYLKIAESESLKKEAEMTAYFHKRGLGAELLSYTTEGADYMLSAKVSGEDCTYEKFLAEPKRLCDLIAERLRELHELEFEDCPVKNRNEEYLSLVRKNYLSGKFDSGLFGEKIRFKSKEEAFSIIEGEKSSLKCDTLLHGDYCLPNIILDNWRFSGFIDLGCAGVGDRHIDIFWGAWTLWFNLNDDRYSYRFLDAYGRDVISRDTLRAIAAAECFV